MTHEIKCVDKMLLPHSARPLAAGRLANHCRGTQIVARPSEVENATVATVNDEVPCSACAADDRVARLLPIHSAAVPHVVAVGFVEWQLGALHDDLTKRTRQEHKQPEHFADIQ